MSHSSNSGFSCAFGWPSIASACCSSPGGLLWPPPLRRPLFSLRCIARSLLRFVPAHGVCQLPLGHIQVCTCTVRGGVELCSVAGLPSAQASGVRPVPCAPGVFHISDLACRSRFAPPFPLIPFWLDPYGSAVGVGHRWREVGSHDQHSSPGSNVGWAWWKEREASVRLVPGCITSVWVVCCPALAASVTTGVGHCCSNFIATVGSPS